MKSESSNDMAGILNPFSFFLKSFCFFVCLFVQSYVKQKLVELNVFMESQLSVLCLLNTAEQLNILVIIEYSDLLLLLVSGKA